MLSFPSPARALGSRPSARADRVLFVDDDSSMRRVFARTMRRQGFIVDLAANGEEALALAEQYTYAVVATDQCMPGIAGLDLVQRLKQGHPESTYVIVTGDRSFVPQRESGEVRQLVIYKPWSNQDLAHVLREAIDQFERRRAQRAQETIPAPSRVGLPVLLLEDSDAIANRVMSLLHDESPGEFRVVHVDNLGRALTLLENQRYAAVLADLNLPDSEGIATVERLHETQARTPLVVLSSMEGEAVSLKAVQRGAQDYLVKNELDGTKLVRALRYAMERKQIERRLEALAHYDQLTGLANRTLFRFELRQALMRGSARGSRTALMLLDLDRFKSVNDSLGHDGGDLLLREVASRLLGSVRELDVVGRLGGDEFAILIGDVSSDEEVLRMAQRVLNSFATPVRLEEREIFTTPSIGIAFAPDNAETEEMLLKYADSAMYRAKDQGRNNYQFFSEELHHKAVRRVQVESELSRAVEHQEFILHYQPQYTLEGRRQVVGVEALIRWQHPDGHLVPPFEFIPILEDTGLIIDVGEWLFQAGCSELRRWTDAGFIDLRLAVNVSPRQFDDDTLVPMIKKALLDWGIAGERLELEITEGVLVKDTNAAKRTLSELAELGVRIAIDDFGTGYSSLQYLKHFPIHVLKIDRSFVKDIERDTSDAAIAGAVVALGKALDLEVVAEGVETHAQVEFLSSLGCNMIQGFLVGRPKPAPELTKLLEKPIRL